MAKKKSMDDILTQGGGMSRVLYHGRGEQNAKRYRNVSNVTTQYLSNIARKLGYRDFLDYAFNTTDRELNTQKFSRRVYMGLANG